jgi:hypothetical protein
VNEGAQSRRETTVECNRSTSRSRKCVDARHSLRVEADPDDGTRRVHLVLVISRYDNRSAACIAGDDGRIERDEQGDAMLGMSRRKRPRRGANAKIVVEVQPDPGIVQAPRRHSL